MNQLKRGWQQKRKKIKAKIDREKNLVGLLMTQVRPYTHINIRRDFQVLTYQSLIEDNKNN